MKRNKSNFVTEITVTDPDTNLPVEIAVYKHENGGMFAIDSSFIGQVVYEEGIIPDPFADIEGIKHNKTVELCED